MPEWRSQGALGWIWPGCGLFFGFSGAGTAGSAGDGDEAPLAGGALELVRAAGLELDPGADDELANGARDEDLAGAGEGEDATTWQGQLPTTGDYTVVVGGTRGNASYTLEVSIY